MGTSHACRSAVLQTVKGPGSSGEAALTLKSHRRCLQQGPAEGSVPHCPAEALCLTTAVMRNSLLALPHRRKCRPSLVARSPAAQHAQ